MQTNQVVKQHRETMNLSMRAFADALNQKLVNTGVTYTTVSRWEDEKSPYEPDMRLLFECIATYQDWRAQFAVDCLRSMWPDLTGSGKVVFNLPRAG
jgi:hypothetical protein